MRATRSITDSLYRLFGIILIFSIWWLGSLWLGPFIVPRPWVTISDTIQLLGNEFAWTQILITLSRVLLGFFSALGAGAVVGVISGSSRSIELIFQPMVLLLQGIPPILWAIPLILVMGIGHLSPILVISLICFPLVVLNIGEGVKTVPRELREMLGVFAPGLYPRLRELVVPHLKPFLLAAVKLGLLLGVKASVVAEYFSANNGIGFQVQAAYHSFQTRTLFAWAVVLVLLILIFDQVLNQLQNLRERVKQGELPQISMPFGNKEEALEQGSLEQGSLEQGSWERGSLERGSWEQTPGRNGTSVRSHRIFLTDVSYRYPGSESGVSGINLKVEASEVAVIYGDSGVGKTTLIRLIASLLKPDSGMVKTPERISLVFQDDRLLPWRTVLENIALPLRYLGTPRDEAFARARRLLGEVGLGNDLFKLPAELSGGMKKRAGLARCFARMPHALLLDEPFSGLHETARSFLWTKLKELLERFPLPTVIVTHFPEEVPIPGAVYRLAGRPAELYPGMGLISEN